MAEMARRRSRGAARAPEEPESQGGACSKPTFPRRRRAHARLARLAIANEKRLERLDVRHHAETVKMLQKFEQERAKEKANDLGDAWANAVRKAAEQEKDCSREKVRDPAIERRASNAEVAGSSPAGTAKFLLPRGSPAHQLAFVPEFQLARGHCLPGVFLRPEAHAGNERVTFTSGEEVGEHVEHIRHGRPRRWRRFFALGTSRRTSYRCCPVHRARPRHFESPLSAAL
jgi:hypothetical protein